MFMMLLPDGSSEVSELEADLTKFPVWRELDEETRLAIIQTAKEYVEKAEPQNEKWLGTNTIHRPAFAGYRAITLVQNVDPDFLETITEDVWRKWAPIIYYYPVYNGSGDEAYDKHLYLVAQAYSKVPDTIIELLWQEIEGKGGEEFWSFDKLKYCWDEKLIESLVLKLKANNLPIQSVRQILTKLFELNNPDAERFACDQISYPIPAEERAKQLLILSIEMLIRFNKTGCWDKIWQIFTTDAEFGKTIIENGIPRFGGQFKDSLNEEQLADMYIWLSQNYPQKEDPRHEGGYFVGPRDDIVIWRDSFLNYLIEKGTEKSVDQFERVRAELPHLTGLSSLQQLVRQKMHEKTWKPFSPIELLRQFHLDPIKNKISNLQKELLRYEKADTLAERITRFSKWETWSITTVITLIWIAVVISNWDTMEKWAWGATSLGWLVMITIVVWGPFYTYFSLNPERAFKQEINILYKKDNLTQEKRDNLSAELERATTHLKESEEAFGSVI